MTRFVRLVAVMASFAALAGTPAAAQPPGFPSRGFERDRDEGGDRDDRREREENFERMRERFQEMRSRGGFGERGDRPGERFGGFGGPGSGTGGGFGSFGGFGGSPRFGFGGSGGGFGREGFGGSGFGGSGFGGSGSEGGGFGSPGFGGFGGFGRGGFGEGSSGAREGDSSRSDGDRRTGTSSSKQTETKRQRVTVSLPDAYVGGDRDKDGQIGLYEWRQWKSRDALAEFSRLDRNSDGFLTPRELVRAGGGTTSGPRGRPAGQNVATATPATTASPAPTSSTAAENVGSQSVAAAPTQTGP